MGDKQTLLSQADVVKLVESANSVKPDTNISVRICLFEELLRGYGWALKAGYSGQ